MPSTPRVQWITATAPKIGNRPEENEDAAAEAGGLRFAVADGATEGWESGPWAKHLAQAYVRRPPGPTDFEQWLASVRQSWTPATDTGPAAWYAVEKQEQGSFAALAGLELRPRGAAEPNRWAWKAVAIGDSCLLHVHDDRVQVAFPLTAPEAFGTQPPLVPSATDAACPEPEWLAGRAEAGDLFLLATDAAAARLLNPTAFAPALAAIRRAFAARKAALLIDWFREVQTTANDDVTLIAVRLPDAVEVS